MTLEILQAEVQRLYLELNEAESRWREARRVVPVRNEPDVFALVHKYSSRFAAYIGTRNQCETEMHMREEKYLAAVAAHGAALAAHREAMRPVTFKARVREMRSGGDVAGVASMYAKRRVREGRDGYIRRLLRVHGEVPEVLIEAKRLQLQIKRALRDNRGEI